MGGSSLGGRTSRDVPLARTRRGEEDPVKAGSDAGPLSASDASLPSRDNDSMLNENILNEDEVVEDGAPREPMDSERGLSSLSEEGGGRVGVVGSSGHWAPGANTTCVMGAGGILFCGTLLAQPMGKIGKRYAAATQKDNAEGRPVQRRREYDENSVGYADAEGSSEARFPGAERRASSRKDGEGGERWVAAMASRVSN
jgi:hypothetical protein